MTSLDQLSNEMASGRNLRSCGCASQSDGPSLSRQPLGPGVIVVIDDYPEFSGRVEDNDKLRLLECLNRGLEYGLYIIVTGDLADLPGDYSDPPLKKIRTQGSGILLVTARGQRHIP